MNPRVLANWHATKAYYAHTSPFVWPRTNVRDFHLQAALIVIATASGGKVRQEARDLLKRLAA